MKKVLSLTAGMVLVLAFGMAYAGGLEHGHGYTSEKMIRDEYGRDISPGTTSEEPALPEVRGSAPGGVTGEGSSEEKSDAGEVEKEKSKPADSGKDIGGPSRGWDPYGY
jgi:hypothetical protein